MQTENKTLTFDQKLEIARKVAELIKKETPPCDNQALITGDILSLTHEILKG